MTRKQKQQQYKVKYGGIPVDYTQRLNWMVDKYNLSPSKMDEILCKRQAMLNSMFYYDYNAIELLEEPEGASRPRVRLLRNNYNKLAITDSTMVHVYVPGAAEDNLVKPLQILSPTFETRNVISPNLHIYRFGLITYIV